MRIVLKVASDLLVTTAPGKKKPPLKIRQDPKKGFYGDTTFRISRLILVQIQIMSLLYIIFKVLKEELRVALKVEHIIVSS